MITNQITIPVPAVQGYFGNRIATYTTQIPALKLRAALGHDPRIKSWKSLSQTTREIYENVQRRAEPKGRHESILGYLEHRFGGPQPNRIGAFPAISIGITSATRFEPISPESALGTLHIDSEAERILLDGLGRVSGCLNLADEGAEGTAIVRKIVLPVTFYVPQPDASPMTIADLGQLFSDFNYRVYPVSAADALRLDSCDPYVQVANDLAKEPFIAEHGGMEKKAPSRGKKSTCLVVQSVLVRVVRGACGGRKFQESNLITIDDNPVLTDETYQHTLGSIAGFFTEIAGRMGRERWTAKDSLHLTAPGWQALGVIYHDVNHKGLQLTGVERTHIYSVIGSLDWSRYNREWSEVAKLGPWEVPAGSDREQVILRYSGRNNVQLIIDYLRKLTGLQSKLDAQKAAVAA